MPRRNTAKKPLRPRLNTQQMLRIIGGEWRSRRVPFPQVEGLRPTPDRVRETLFNWLQNVTPGARCLDLFAGSGALGLEALSRGATSATFVDQSPEAVRQLRENLQTLKAHHHEVISSSALSWLAARQKDIDSRYDLVFLDPPFRQGLVAEVGQLLEDRRLLADNAMIYVETESELQQLSLPPHWQEHRCKIAGQVTYRLYSRQPAN